MANTKGGAMNEQDTTTENAPKRRPVLKILAGVLMLFLLVCVGFFAGIYLRIFDVDQLNESMKLYDMPLIGQYFVKREASVKQEETASADVKTKDEKAKSKEQKRTESRSVVLTKAEIEKQKKEQQAAERKRVSKLARLYNGMKPKDAAAIMDALNDDITVAILQRMDESQCAKVLTEFEPEKSARLTRTMYSGARGTMSSPGDAENASRGEELEPALH